MYFNTDAFDISSKTIDQVHILKKFFFFKKMKIFISLILASSTIPNLQFYSLAHTNHINVFGSFQILLHEKIFKGGIPTVL